MEIETDLETILLKGYIQAKYEKLCEDKPQEFREGVDRGIELIFEYYRELMKIYFHIEELKEYLKDAN